MTTTKVTTLLAVSAMLDCRAHSSWRRRSGRDLKPRPRGYALRGRCQQRQHSDIYSRRRPKHLRLRDIRTLWLGL